MSTVTKDILIAVLFVIGLVGFISGEFIILSTLLFRHKVPPCAANSNRCELCDPKLTIDV